MKFARIAMCSAGLFLPGYLPPCSGQATGFTVKTAKLFRTARGAEKVRVLPLPVLREGARQDVYEVVYSVQLPPLRRGDVIQVTSEMEATNDCGYDIQFGTWIVHGQQASTTVPAEKAGEAYIAYPAGFNITNGNYQLPLAGERAFMHHGLVTRSGAYSVARDMRSPSYINVIGYALSDKLDCAKGGGLTVGRGYGHLSVTLLSSQ